ncbi:MAG: hypothetical protein ACREEA_06045 [Stellaceae bacterium]
MAARGETETDIQARSLFLTRVFDAPRALVFAAFSDPVHLA